MLERGAPERAHPLHHSVGGHDAHFQPPVFGTRMFERLDAAEDRPDVAEEDAAGVVVEPLLALDVDPVRTRLPGGSSRP